MRSTSRMTDTARNTIAKLLLDAGRACWEYQNKTLVDLHCKRIQCDEIWSYCYCKERQLKTAKNAPSDAGDIWLWIALDADSKLVPCYTIGERDPDTAHEFISDLQGRLAERVQITTDGLSTYLIAIEDVFQGDVDYAMLVKTYGPDGGNPSGSHAERKYSPGKVNGARKERIFGNPRKADVSTSYIERQNLTLRMSSRRFTRLTNAFSKSVEYHIASIHLHYMYYNFVRPHASLGKGITPAMAAGVAFHKWDMEEVAGLLSK